MFVQIISGRCTDPAGIKKQWERWEEELKPGAVGFLGSTGGLTPDGTFFTAARFESAEAAQKNSDRPEQGAWWSETEQYLEGVTFKDCTDIQDLGTGGSDDAGFVQVIQGQTTDRERLSAMDQQFEKEMPNARPDLIGGYQMWDSPNSFISVNYFTSEAEARKGESKEMPESMKKAFEEWGSLMQDVQFLDLPEPWYSSK